MLKKIGIGFLIIIGIIVTFFVLLSTKVYPVATVNDGLISARTFQIATTAAEHYYGNLLTLGSATTSVDVFKSEMRRLALQTLIEDELVMSHLKTVYESASLEAVVAQKMEGALSSSAGNKDEAVRELFGISLEEFKQIVLAPRARLELLAEDLARTQVDPAAWLVQALEEADVTISLSDLAWNDGAVELTGQQSYTAKIKETLQGLASSTEALRQASSTLPQ